MLLISSTISWIANDTDFYTAGFKKYDIAAKTGIAEAGLNQVAQQFVEYFNSEQEYLDIKITQRGQLVNLFNPREIQHMRDVKGLVNFGYLVQWLSLLFTTIFTSIGLFWWKGKKRRITYKLVLIGCLATLFVIFLIGGMVLFNFEGFFLGFHLLSFTNDLWVLDPLRDNLIQMFPEGFFFDAALFVGGLVALEAAIGCGFMLFLIRGKKRYQGINS